MKNRHETPANRTPLWITLALAAVLTIATIGVILVSNPSVPETAAERQERLSRPLSQPEPMPPDLDRAVHPFGHPKSTE
ncbi:MAG: hypothetical protein KIT79_13825 [Deltaproteobacteria bacterium]|nr:hypothetical protein [Deltaproteobacteria bacterium]